jgi:fructuronate reductase
MTAPLLSRGTLGRVPAASRPLLEPGATAAGIVHLGLGAFHRAHQAVYTEEAVAAAGGDWGIVGVAPRSPGVVDALRAQDNLFSVASVSAGGRSTRVVGVLAGVRLAAADPDAVVALLADPAIRIVTLTVTEKGYRLDPATGRPTIDDEVRADLGTDRPPRTIPGLLARGLAARRRAGAGPIALVSCDNLPSNGRRLAGLISAVADPADLTGVTFPSTMVDRIVPASTSETYALAEAALGVRDLAAVSAEPYRQWVIEDDFPAGRPAWEKAGAVLTADAGPWERLKLRTLNGVHSAVAYLGALAGEETIAGAVELPGMRTVMRRFVAEDVAPGLTPPDGVDVVAYGDECVGRFADPALGHRTVQVAMDGSQKLPQRVLETVAARRAAGAMPRWGALIIAAWIRFAQGTADDGRTLPLDDPLASELTVRSAAHDPVDEVFGLEAVFPPNLAGDDALKAEVRGWLAALIRHGVKDTLVAA